MVYPIETLKKCAWSAAKWNHKTAKHLPSQKIRVKRKERVQLVHERQIQHCTAGRRCSHWKHHSVVTLNDGVAEDKLMMPEWKKEKNLLLTICSHDAGYKSQQKRHLKSNSSFSKILRDYLKLVEWCNVAQLSESWIHSEGVQVQIRKGKYTVVLLHRTEVTELLIWSLHVVVLQKTAEMYHNVLRTCSTIVPLTKTYSFVKFSLSWREEIVKSCQETNSTSLVTLSWLPGNYSRIVIG